MTLDEAWTLSSKITEYISFDVMPESIFLRCLEYNRVFGEYTLVIENPTMTCISDFNKWYNHIDLGKFITDSIILRVPRPSKEGLDYYIQKTIGINEGRIGGVVQRYSNPNNVVRRYKHTSDVSVVTDLLRASPNVSNIKGTIASLVVNEGFNDIVDKSINGFNFSLPSSNYNVILANVHDIITIKNKIRLMDYRALRDNGTLFDSLYI